MSKERPNLKELKAKQKQRKKRTLTKTEKKAFGKRYRNLSKGFEDCQDQYSKLIYFVAHIKDDELCIVPDNTELITEWVSESELGTDYDARHYLLRPEGVEWDGSEAYDELRKLALDAAQTVREHFALFDPLNNDPDDVLPWAVFSGTIIEQWMRIVWYVQNKRKLPQHRQQQIGTRTINKDVFSESAVVCKNLSTLCSLDENDITKEYRALYEWAKNTDMLSKDIAWKIREDPSTVSRMEILAEARDHWEKAEALKYKESQKAHSEPKAKTKHREAKTEEIESEGYIYDPDTGEIAE